MNNIIARQGNTAIQAANDTKATDTTLPSAPPGHLNTRAVHHYPAPAAASQSGSTQTTHTIAQELLAAIPAERLGSSIKQKIAEIANSPEFRADPKDHMDRLNSKRQREGGYKAVEDQALAFINKFISNRPAPKAPSPLMEARAPTMAAIDGADFCNQLLEAAQAASLSSEYLAEMMILTFDPAFSSDPRAFMKRYDLAETAVSLFIRDFIATWDQNHVVQNNAAPAPAAASASAAAAVPASVTLSQEILTAATLKGNELGVYRSGGAEIRIGRQTVYSQIQAMVNKPAFQLNPRDFIDQEKRALSRTMNANRMALQFIDEFLKERERTAIEQASQKVNAAQQYWTTKNLTSREKATVAGLISADTREVQALMPQLIEVILDYSKPISSDEILAAAHADENFHVLERPGMSISNDRDELLARVAKIVTTPEFQDDPVRYMTEWNERAAASNCFSSSEDIPRMKLTQILVDKGLMEPLPEVNPFMGGSSVISGGSITIGGNGVFGGSSVAIGGGTITNDESDSSSDSDGSTD